MPEDFHFLVELGLDLVQLQLRVYHSVHVGRQSLHVLLSFLVDVLLELLRAVVAAGRGTAIVAGSVASVALRLTTGNLPVNWLLGLLVVHLFLEDRFFLLLLLVLLRNIRGASAELASKSMLDGRVASENGVYESDQVH